MLCDAGRVIIDLFKDQNVHCRVLAIDCFSFLSAYMILCRSNDNVSVIVCQLYSGSLLASSSATSTSISTSTAAATTSTSTFASTTTTSTTTTSSSSLPTVQRPLSGAALTTSVDAAPASPRTQRLLTLEVAFLFEERKKKLFSYAIFV